MTITLQRPKDGTKEARLVSAISGAGKTIDQLSALLSWKPHTVRAAFTRLRARGYQIERVAKTERSPAKFRLKGKQ